MAQPVGAALVVGADDTSQYEMTRDESFVMSEQRRRAFMRAVPSYSSSTLNTVASESYCIPEDVLHAAGGTSTPEKKQNQASQPSESPVPVHTYRQNTATATQAQEQATPTKQHNRNIQTSSSAETLRDSDLDRFEDAEEDLHGSPDSPDTSGEVCVATVARLAPPSTGTRGIFHKNSGIGHGFGHRPPQPPITPRPQTHDPRAKVKSNNSGPAGVYARIKMKEVEIERQFDTLVRQAVKSKKEGNASVAAEKPRAASDSASISSRESQASRADRVANLQQQSDKLFELSRSITVEIDLIKKMGPATAYKNFSANSGSRSTNLTENLADLETKKQAVERELYQVGLLLSRQYIKMRDEGASEYWVRSVSK
ncbi:hypothetical protein CJU90_1302 [Yarrowia sp. C11]|nr:hypothetical protein CKK34_0028 [Yarrowia sp. E02]KAG5371288.1 hypothetical protein CJU90_1302 [Yarrowia sp. C11]